MVGVSGLLLMVVGKKVSNKVEGSVKCEAILDEDVNNVDWPIEEVITFKVVNNVGVKNVDCILLVDITVENEGLLVVDW